MRAPKPGDECPCGLTIRLLTAWTADNPGRRFWTCGQRVSLYLVKCLFLAGIRLIIGDVLLFRMYVSSVVVCMLLCCTCACSFF